MSYVIFDTPFARALCVVYINFIWGSYCKVKTGIPFLDHSV